MRLMGQLGNACRIPREHISLHLDGELSEFEQIALDAHLRQCASCRDYEASLADVTSRLRTAPLEQPAFPVVLPHRSRFHVPVRAGQAAAAAVVVAVIGFAAAGVTPGSERSVLLSAPSAPSRDPAPNLSPERVARGGLDVRFQEAPRQVRRGVMIV
jgi:predicted anti-sigma-YlaC factor YlaD